MTRRLVPTFGKGVLYPEDAAWMARTDRQITRLLGYTDFNVDAVTGKFLGFFGQQPSVRHISSVTPEILSYLSGAGLVIEEDMRVFRTADEALVAAQSLVQEGFRFLAPYPLPAHLFDDAACVVPSTLWYRLNAKVRLGDLVDQRNLAPRRVVTASDAITPPVYLKAGGAAVTGWGYAVRHCETAEDVDAAMQWFRDNDAENDLLAEQVLDVATCWCANFCCSDDATHYLGAAEQTFSAAGKQSGSVIDLANPLPLAGRDIVCAAGETARQLGFRGMAALDIGLTRDNNFIVFDPNFRVNASTPQILLHDVAAEGHAWPVSQSASGMTGLPMSELIARLEETSRAGWFVPTQLLDGALLPAAKGQSCWGGFVMGTDREEADARRQKLSDLLAS